MMKTKNELPIMLFRTVGEWREWLEQHHGQTDGIWMRCFHKGKGDGSVSHEQGLDEALCFGWIDSQALKYDDASYLQKFTPRRRRSIWSKRNIGKVEQLIKEGRMTPAGLAEVDAAKADGRWQQAYDSPTNMEIPQDFLQELEKSPAAKEFFATLNKTNLFAIGWRLQTAKKEETRQRRMKAIIAMLSEGKKLY